MIALLAIPYNLLFLASILALTGCYSPQEHFTSSLTAAGDFEVVTASALASLGKNFVPSGVDATDERIKQRYNCKVGYYSHKRTIKIAVCFSKIYLVNQNKISLTVEYPTKHSKDYKPHDVELIRREIRSIQDELMANIEETLRKKNIAVLKKEHREGSPLEFLKSNYAPSFISANPRE